MGKICSKEKKGSLCSSRSKNYKKTVIIRPPEKGQIYTRETLWVGLKNLHNTCFINSVLQCFSGNNTLMGYMHNIEFIIEQSFTESLKKFLM